MVESSTALKPWREAVKEAALNAKPSGWLALDAPLWVSMVFTVRKPIGAPKSRRTWPMRTPDLSKLIRATEDAITDAGVWADDARVVGYVDTAKTYPREGMHSLSSPGASILIWGENPKASWTELDPLNAFGVNHGCSRSDSTRMLGLDPRLWRCNLCGRLCDHDGRPAPAEWLAALGVR